MGRSIVREPQVFLMDEPLSNLDAKLRVQMRAEISAVVRSLNTTTLYVTHDQTEAMTMGDRMAVLKAGLLQQLGTPGDCYDTPNNIFVAQFVGSPPMNLVTAKINQAGEGLELEFGGSKLAIPASVLAETARPEELRRPHGRARRAQRGHGGRHAPPGPRAAPSRARSTSPRRWARRSSCTSPFPARPWSPRTPSWWPRTTPKEELHIIADKGVRWVASFAPRSRVRMGDDIEIVVDVERVHYFDAETSEAIRG